MASSQAPISILKQPKKESSSTSTDEQKEKAALNRKHLGIALYHANKIQDQKRATEQILFSIEELSELPAGAEPKTAECNKFLEKVQIFQPSDFDALVEERCANDRCGYTLCARAPRSANLGSSAAWRLDSKAAGDYCSDLCLKKALYIRTQLSEVPVWERGPAHNPFIALHGTTESREDTRRRKRAEQQVTDHQDLAFERGETQQSHKPKQVMTDFVVEKPFGQSDLLQEEKTLENPAHEAVEGYEPKKKANRSSTVGHNFDSDEEKTLQEPVVIEETDLLDEFDQETEDSWQYLQESIDQRHRD